MARRLRTRIGHEAAEASRATTWKQRRGYPATLIAEARELEKAMTARRKVKKELKRLDTMIRQKRKLLKALAGAEAGETL